MAYTISIISQHAPEIYWSELCFFDIPTGDQICAECLKFMKDQVNPHQDTIYMNWTVFDGQHEAVKEGTFKIAHRTP